MVQGGPLWPWQEEELAAKKAEEAQALVLKEKSSVDVITRRGKSVAERSSIDTKRRSVERSPLASAASSRATKSAPAARRRRAPALKPPWSSWALPQSAGAMLLATSWSAWTGVKWCRAP